MAFALTLPLVGLEPRNFSALSTRLRCETIYESPCVSEQNSPNTIDSNEAGGSGYAAHGSKNDQKASQSSYSAEIERQRKERESKDLRVMHQGRNILNLAANIRDPIWKKDEKFRGLTSNRSIAQRLNEQQRTEDQTSAACPNCKFRQPKPYLY